MSYTYRKATPTLGYIELDGNPVSNVEINELGYLTMSAIGVGQSLAERKKRALPLTDKYKGFIDTVLYRLNHRMGGREYQ